MPKVPKISCNPEKYAIHLCNPEKHGGWSWFFCLQINTKVCYKLIISLLLCVVSYAQRAEINKLAMSLKYLNFLSSNKYQRFLQIYAVILRVCGQTCPNTQNNKFTISLWYLKKEAGHEVNFLHADKYESFL